MKLESYQIVAISSWIARIMQAILQIFIIRLLTTILNIEDYAMYTLLIVLLGWIALSDFGIPISLQNHISQLRANDNEYKDFIGNAIFLSIFMFLILAISFYPLSMILAPEYLINFSLENSEKIQLFYLSIVIMLLTVISSLIYKIYFAIHKGYISNLIPALGTIVSFIFIYLVSIGVFNIGTEHNLYLTLLFSLIPQAIFPFILLIVFVIKNNIKIKFDKNISRKILHRGFHFWIFAILAVLTLQVDYLIASRFLSSSDIILYSTLSKLFLLGFFIYNSILMALWPVVSEHLHKNEWENVIKYIKIYIPIGILFITIFSIFLYLSQGFIFSFLIKNTVLEANLNLIILFAIYFAIRVWTDTFAMVLQSINILKPFWIIVPFQALISLISQILLTERFGLCGLLYGLILSFLLTVVWYLPYQVRKLFLSKGI